MHNLLRASIGDSVLYTSSMPRKLKFCCWLRRFLLMPSTASSAWTALIAV